MTDKEPYKELNSISMLNVVGIIGIFIPLVGWIFSGMAIGRTSRIYELMSEEQIKSHPFKGRIQNIRLVAAVLILFSCVSFGYWMIQLSKSSSESSDPSVISQPMYEYDQPSY